MIDEATSRKMRIEGYAAAMLDVARAEGDPDGLSDELIRVAGAFGQSEELRSVLRDPLIPFERKQGVVDDLLGGRASQVTISLVNLLVGAGRIGDFSAIAQRMASLAAETEEYTIAEVRTAFELDEATLARLTEKLAAATGRRIKPRVVVDPTLLGGVVAKVGDTVFDGSVRSRIQDLREAWG
jgi:F-type H+-transporting ATPase subunit delta